MADTSTENSVECTLSSQILEAMKTQYFNFISDLTTLFQKNQIDVRSILSMLYSHDNNNLSMFLNDGMIESWHGMPVSVAINVMFSEIRRWKFCDYGVIEQIVKISKCKEAEKMLQDYTYEINGVLMKDITKYQPVIGEMCISERNIRVLKIKCKEDNISVGQWNAIKQALCRCFGFPEGTLKFDSTISGCLTIICKFLLQAKNHLMQLKITKRQLKPLTSMRITCLTIDDEVELKVPPECDTEVINTTMKSHCQ